MVQAYPRANHRKYPAQSLLYYRLLNALKAGAKSIVRVGVDLLL